jgi:hypothetical protein
MLSHFEALGNGYVDATAAKATVRPNSAFRGRRAHGTIDHGKGAMNWCE